MGKVRKIRVRDGFSDRNKINEIPKNIQYDDFTSDTRIVLFNHLNNILNHQISTCGYDSNAVAKQIVEGLFSDVYIRREDSYACVIDEILELVKTSSYDSVLTIIEFLCELVYESKEEYQSRNHYDAFSLTHYFDIFEAMNECFEAEYIGYRFINRKIVKITNKDEISTIIDSYSTPYDSINKSICKAISMLSEISKKDYENCIKEAILATEECLNIILGTKGKTLGVAVDELFKKVPLNDNLKILLKDLYKYASDTNGIRHGNNKQKQSISFDEAKYILVISSATINYLISLKRNNL